jgi:hypothetical protein
VNILKHMEAVFVATVALAVSGSYMIDAIPEAHAKAAVVATSTAAVPVVVVKAKRMSAEEKARDLQAERNASFASRI